MTENLNFSPFYTFWMFRFQPLILKISYSLVFGPFMNSIFLENSSIVFRDNLCNKPNVNFFNRPGKTPILRIHHLQLLFSLWVLLCSLHFVRKFNEIDSLICLLSSRGLSIVKLCSLIYDLHSFHSLFWTHMFLRLWPNSFSSQSFIFEFSL